MNYRDVAALVHLAHDRDLVVSLDYGGNTIEGMVTRFVDDTYFEIVDHGQPFLFSFHEVVALTFS